MIDVRYYFYGLFLKNWQAYQNFLFSCIILKSYNVFKSVYGTCHQDGGMRLLKCLLENATDWTAKIQQGNS